MDNLKIMFQNVSELSDQESPLFPIEIDLASNAFEYSSVTIPLIREYKDDDEFENKTSKANISHLGNRIDKDETICLLSDL